MAIELTKKDIAELSAIVQQNVEAELQGDKLQRMQAFGRKTALLIQTVYWPLHYLKRNCMLLCLQHNC